MVIAHASRLRPWPRRTLMIATSILAVLTWPLAAIVPLRGTESLSVLVPILTVVLLALAIRWAPGARQAT
jgi:hypothetical protein